MRFAPKKYVCSVCGKGFRRNKQHYNHVNRAHRNLGTKSKKQVVIEPIVEQELVSLKPERVHSEPQTTKYYGRDYQFNPIATGMRHLRSGLALPTLSKHKYGAQAI